MRNLDDRTIYTIPEVNSEAAKRLEQINGWVEGEICEYNRGNPTNKYYTFSIKDSDSGYVLPCQILNSVLNILDTKYKDGDKVIVGGSLCLWQRTGTYKFTVKNIEYDGEGASLRKLKELKEKLFKSGYFDPAHKIDIPPYPKNIVFISARKAGWEDFKINTAGKYKFLNLTLKEVSVQGVHAVDEICKAIEELDKLDFDVIVLGRGGGSNDDLSAFNDEKIASAIFNCKTPLITAIGHQIDINIADLVADVYVSTPSMAANFITQNFDLLFQRLENAKFNLSKKIVSLKDNLDFTLDYDRTKLDGIIQRLNYLPEKLQFLSTALKVKEQYLIQEKFVLMDAYQKKIILNITDIFIKKSDQLHNLDEKLRLLSPLNVLDRGYSITRMDNGQIVKSSRNINVGDVINVQLKDGTIISEAKDVK